MNFLKKCLIRSCTKLNALHFCRRMILCAEYTLISAHDTLRTPVEEMKFISPLNVFSNIEFY